MRREYEPVRCDMNGDPGRTVQSDAQAADINNIVNRWLQTGEVYAPRQRPEYGDFTNATDYLTAVNKVNDAQQAFAELPSRIRSKFKNDPFELIEFLDDEANHPEAVELGILVAPDQAAPEVPDAPVGESPPSEE